MRALAAVAAVFALVQLAITRNVPFAEVIYLSQVADGPAFYMSAPRSYATSWLLAPIAAFTADLQAVRAYLAVLSAAAMFVAFLPWLRVHQGYVAPAAARDTSHSPRPSRLSPWPHPW